MQRPEQRDEKTISITIALLVFVGVLVAGGLVVGTVVSVFNIGGKVGEVVVMILVLVAAFASVRYLATQTRASKP